MLAKLKNKKDYEITDKYFETCKYFPRVMIISGAEFNFFNIQSTPKLHFVPDPWLTKHVLL